MAGNSDSKGTLGGELLSSEVYKVYHQELVQHLKRFEQIIEFKELTEEILSETRIRFHTIKGGAGFFGLAKIADVAGEMEKKASEKRLQVTDLENAVVSIRGASTVQGEL